VSCHRRTYAPPTLSALACLCVFAAVSDAVAQDLYINEVYFNQPSRRNLNTDPDSSHAYVELRGAPCQMLTNTYLVFLENEASGAGTIEGMFNLSDVSLGANGYLTIRQRAVTDPMHPVQYNDYTVNPKANHLRNAAPDVAEGPLGIGFGQAGASTVGASWSPNSLGVFSGGFEGSGFSALLIQTDGVPANAPTLDFDVDTDNNGFDVPNGHEGWTILDSIGLFAEANEALDGQSYAQLTFGFESTVDFPDFNPADHIPDGGTYEFVNWPELEAEYIGRIGNSTGHAPADWVVANLTDRPVPAGFTNMGDFRVAAQPHVMNAPPETVEATPYVPYGTTLTNSVGGPNYPLDPISYPTPLAGDFDGDRDVDMDDLNQQWIPRFACGDLDGTDFLNWQRNLGMVSTPPSVASQAALPEPAGAGLIATASLAACGLTRIPSSRPQGPHIRRIR
jgi:hypothetical protein